MPNKSQILMAFNVSDDKLVAMKIDMSLPLSDDFIRDPGMDFDSGL